MSGLSGPLRSLAREAWFGARIATGEAARARRAQRGGLVALTAHQFTTANAPGPYSRQPIRQFARHLRHLQRCYRVVSLDEAFDRLAADDGRDARPLAVLTLDDGFADNFDLLFPVLQELRMPAAFFVVIDFIDRGHPPWPVEIAAIFEIASVREIRFPLNAPIATPLDRALATAAIKKLWKGETPETRRVSMDRLRGHVGAASVTPERLPAMSWGQLRALRAAGHTIGSHTVHHSILPFMTDAVARDELVRSKARIESEMNAPCRFFAYPNGNADARVAALALEAGYEAAFTQTPGVNHPDGDRMLAPRMNLPPTDRLASFICRIVLSGT